MHASMHLDIHLFPLNEMNHDVCIHHRFKKEKEEESKFPLGLERIEKIKKNPI